MSQKKHCAVCNSEVKRGEGVFYNHRLVHRRCLSMARAIWYKLGQR